MPQPQVAAVGPGRGVACRGVHHQARVVRHLQGPRRQAGAFQAVFDGVPPGHFNGGQFDVAGAGGHQRLAVFANAQKALFNVLVAQLRLVRVAAQAIDVGQGQRRQLGAGQAFGAQGQAAGQGVSDLRVLGLRVPAFAQAQAAGRQQGASAG